MSQLITRHPDLKKHLYNDEGKLRSFVNLYVNDEDVRYGKNMDTPVKDNDELSIIPSIAGGSQVVEQAQDVEETASVGPQESLRAHV